MQLSLSVSLLILIVAASLGWRDHQRLASSRERHAKLVAEAVPLGITLDPTDPSRSIRVAHAPAARATRSKLTTAECIAYIKEMKEAEKQRGDQPDEAMQLRRIEFMERLAALNVDELKALLAALQAAPDLDNESRQDLVFFTLKTLTNDHPKTALSVLLESPDLLQSKLHTEILLPSALARVANDDPMWGLEWIRDLGGNHPNLVNDDAKRNLFFGTAIRNPKLAFQLIDEFGFTESNGEVSVIVRAARTPEERTATLAALRDRLATLDSKRADNEREQAMQSFAHTCAKDDFESAISWIASAHLSPKEFNDFAWSLPNVVKSAETGRWIEWMGQTLPDKAIDDMMSRWTENDYQAAGSWLTQAADSPAKQTAAASYAETVAPYEPETAEQWAMTLPVGKKRDATLKSIYRKWPKNDPAAKQAEEAFADQHGIKR
jgi:hypothetical protein